jgi:hypothetical protein
MKLESETNRAVRIILRIFGLGRSLNWSFKNESKIIQFRIWDGQGYISPSPNFIKKAIVVGNAVPHSTFIETGTFVGEMANEASRYFPRVISLEPEKTLFELNVARFEGTSNVELHNGTSEDLFTSILQNVSGDVTFWLDGHYGGPRTFKGKIDSPIIFELDAISKNINRFGSISILVDDVRTFDPGMPNFASYPHRSYLVNWADKNEFNWTIEHDIFICKNY